jgi:hypothetical protein
MWTLSGELFFGASERGKVKFRGIPWALKTKNLQFSSNLA